MIGLVYLLFFAIYLLISAYVIYRATLYARRKYNKGWVGGWLAAFLMYNLVFWDWLPVYVMHKYYCATEAGFWVYKSPEQWIKENPGMVGQRWGVNELKKSEVVNEKTSRYWSSDRTFEQITQSNSFLNEIVRSEYSLIDNETGSVMSRSVEFTRGATIGHSLSKFKFWLAIGSRNCGATSSTQGFMDSFTKNRYLLERLGKGEIQ